MFSDLSPSQAKSFVDLEQAHLACQDTLTKMSSYTGGMHWKTIGGKQYLYRTLDGRGNAKSLGPRSPETETLHEQFHQRRADLELRLVAQRQRLDEQKRMAKALRIGSAPRVLGEICKALNERGLMGRNILVIGTNALYAYESLAGVRFQSDVTATQDVDLLFKHQSRLVAVARDLGPDGLIGVLRAVDKTFEISETQAFRAINANGYMVDLIRQTPKPPWRPEPHNLGEKDDFVATDISNMDWMLSSPRLRQLVVADNGAPFEMEVPDPRAFMMFKFWLSQQPDREPIKRRRDAAQAQSVRQLLVERLPQFPVISEAMTAFPASLVDSCCESDPDAPSN